MRRICTISMQASSVRHGWPPIKMVLDEVVHRLEISQGLLMQPASIASRHLRKLGSEERPHLGRNAGQLLPIGASACLAVHREGSSESIEWAVCQMLRLQHM